MIWLLAPIGLFAAVMLYVFWAIVRDRRELRRWRAERVAIALMHEMLAREATRPNGHVDEVGPHR